MKQFEKFSFHCAAVEIFCVIFSNTEREGGDEYITKREKMIMCLAFSVVTCIELLLYLQMYFVNTQFNHFPLLDKKKIHFLAR